MSHLPTYREALVDTVKGLLTAWSRAKWPAHAVWKSLCETVGDVAHLLLLLLAPLLLPLAPLVAWLYLYLLKKEHAFRGERRARYNQLFGGSEDDL